MSLRLWWFLIGSKQLLLLRKEDGQPTIKETNREKTFLLPTDCISFWCLLCKFQWAVWAVCVWELSLHGFPTPFWMRFSLFIFKLLTYSTAFLFEKRGKNAKMSGMRARPGRAPCRPVQTDLVSAVLCTCSGRFSEALGSWVFRVILGFTLFSFLWFHIIPFQFSFPRLSSIPNPIVLSCYSHPFSHTGCLSKHLFTCLSQKII